MATDTVDDATLSTAPTVRPFLWGFFQGLMCLPGAFVTSITAYVFPGPWRIVNSVTAVTYVVVFAGFMGKRRFGFVGYYMLVALALFSYARVMSIILLRPHTRLRYLPPTTFLLVTLAIAAWWIVPAIFYYPKRWKEFR